MPTFQQVRNAIISLAHDTTISHINIFLTSGGTVAELLKYDKLHEHFNFSKIGNIDLLKVNY